MGMINNLFTNRENELMNNPDILWDRFTDQIKSYIETASLRELQIGGSIDTKIKEIGNKVKTETGIYPTNFIKNLQKKRRNELEKLTVKYCFQIMVPRKLRKAELITKKYLESESDPDYPLIPLEKTRTEGGEVIKHFAKFKNIHGEDISLKKIAEQYEQIANNKTAGQIFEILYFYATRYFKAEDKASEPARESGDYFTITDTPENLFGSIGATRSEKENMIKMLMPPRKENSDKSISTEKGLLEEIRYFGESESGQITYVERKFLTVTNKEYVPIPGKAFSGKTNISENEKISSKLSLLEIMVPIEFFQFLKNEKSIKNDRGKGKAGSGYDKDIHAVTYWINRAIEKNNNASSIVIKNQIFLEEQLSKAKTKEEISLVKNTGDKLNGLTHIHKIDNNAIPFQTIYKYIKAKWDPAAHNRTQDMIFSHSDFVRLGYLKSNHKNKSRRIKDMEHIRYVLSEIVHNHPDTLLNCETVSLSGNGHELILSALKIHI